MSPAKRRYEPRSEQEKSLTQIENLKSWRKRQRRQNSNNNKKKMINTSCSWILMNLFRAKLWLNNLLVKTVTFLDEFIRWFVSIGFLLFFFSLVKFVQQFFTNFQCVEIFIIMADYCRGGWFKFIFFFLFTKTRKMCKLLASINTIYYWTHSLWMHDAWDTKIQNKLVATASIFLFN